MKRESMLPFEDDAAVIEAELQLPAGKTNFKPEELYRFTKIKPFVLRFWESEFPSLKPVKKGMEGPAYSRADVEMILAIKHLLYDEGLTLAEARQRLTGEDEEVPGRAGSGTPYPRQEKKRPSRPAKRKKGSQKTGSGAPEKKKAPETAAPAASAKLPGAGRGKRGLPDDGAARSRVSLEELLPGNGSAAVAAAGPEKSGRTKASAPAAALSPPKADSEALALRLKLSTALSELRQILTFLNKGDR